MDFKAWTSTKHQALLRSIHYIIKERPTANTFLINIEQIATTRFTSTAYIYIQKSLAGSVLMPGLVMAYINRPVAVSLLRQKLRAASHGPWGRWYLTFRTLSELVRLVVCLQVMGNEREVRPYCKLCWSGTLNNPSCWRFIMGLGPLTVSPSSESNGLSFWKISPSHQLFKPVNQLVAGLMEPVAIATNMDWVRNGLFISKPE